MSKSAIIWISLSLMVLSGCAAKSPQVVSAPPIYQGLPDALLARCTVQAVNEVVTGDIIVNRIRYKSAFEKCAAQVDAIRAHDQKAREIASGQTLP